MNSAFVGNEKENLQNLVEALIAELAESVFKSGTIRAIFYENETPRFTKGKVIINTKVSMISKAFFNLGQV